MEWQSKRPRVIKHNSHHDLSKWHFNLHHSVVKECPQNSLPKFVGKFIHPTHATLSVVRNHGAVQAWSSRDHRKHRHVEASPAKKLRRRRHSLLGKLALMRRLEYWNISWWVAQAFTWGSVIWVLNGFAAFLPLVNSHFNFSLATAGWTAFIGATIFEIGSVLGILEAWNRNDTAAFGWNVIEVLNHSKNSVLGGYNNDSPNRRIKTESTQADSEELMPPRKRWIWFTTDTKYFHELGFLAAFFQLLGATVFWISGFTALPEIQTALATRLSLKNGIFWTPQVIGGSGFIISSIFIMLESQKVWWRPRITSIGWQVGVWNFIGAIGFTLSGAFGYSTSSGAIYQSALSTFWGGWAFLIGSVIQWFESVNSIMG